MSDILNPIAIHRYSEKYLNVDLISKYGFTWIMDNPELFRKYLMNHFDFIGKGITHWKLIVDTSKSYLFEVFLSKGTSTKKSWFIINGSTPSDISYVYLRQNSYKNLDFLWSECNKGFVNDILITIDRDLKLNELIN